MNDNQVDALLRASTPCPDDRLTSPALARAETALCEAIMAAPTLVAVAPPARRRRRVARVLAIGAVAMSLSAATWAVLDARTGHFGGGPGSEEGAGEFIRLDLPGAAEIVDGIAGRVPLPPGGSFDETKAFVLRPEQHNGRAVGRLMTESGIESTFAYAAACQWTGYWLAGFERGDPEQMARAQPVLDEIPTWPIVVAADGSGYVALLQRRAEGARTGNPDAFIHEYRVNCPG